MLQKIFFYILYIYIYLPFYVNLKRFFSYR